MSRLWCDLAEIMAEHGFTGILKSMCSFFGGMKPVSGISPFLYLLLPVFIVLIAVVGGMVRILREYERAVVFTVGRLDKVKGPGLVLLFSFIQQMVRVDLRIQVIEIPS